MGITKMVGIDKVGQPNVAVVDGSTWGIKESLYLETTHIGLVLSLGEHNFYDDSDFYATVWNPEAKKPEEIDYGTTRAWTYPNHAKVDATPEVVAAYEEYRQNEAKKLMVAREERLAKQIVKGKKVRVIRGRKVAIGTEGVVFWMKAQNFTPRFRNGYNPSEPDTIKIGIALDDQKDERGRNVNVAWTYAKNVEVI